MGPRPGLETRLEVGLSLETVLLSPLTPSSTIPMLPEKSFLNDTWKTLPSIVVKVKAKAKKDHLQIMLNDNTTLIKARGLGTALATLP